MPPLAVRNYWLQARPTTTWQEIQHQQAAQQLGVTRTALSRVLNGHAAISPEMARRIEAWLGPERGGRAEIWLGMQMDYDLWVAEQKPVPQVTRAPDLLAA